jgi:hypothetical protein
MEQKAAHYQDAGGGAAINKSVSTKANAMKSAANKNLNPRDKMSGPTSH